MPLKPQSLKVSSVVFQGAPVGFSAPNMLVWSCELKSVPLMQEACGAKDAELASLRAALAQYEQKIRTLELSNYSLSMHLRQATETGRGFDSGQRPPDVY